MQGKKLTQRTKTSLSNGRDRTKRRLPTDCPLRISFWGTYHTVLDATHGDGLSMLAGSPGSKSASKTAPDLKRSVQRARAAPPQMCEKIFRSRGHLCTKTAKLSVARVRELLLVAGREV
jgi:hypothetical protein